MKTIPNTFSLRQLRAVACVGAALLGHAALAQAPVTTDARDRDRAVRDGRDGRDGRAVRDNKDIKSADRNFIEKAFRSSLDEMEISRIAAERTSNANVRRMAQMITSDHESVREELATVASSRGVALPAKNTEPNKWAKRDAKDFDKDYIAAMVSHHENAVSLYEKQARTGDDPMAVAFARKHLPKLQEHLYHALDLKRLMD